MKPRQAKRRGGDERSGAVRKGAGAADVVNPLWASMRSYGRNRTVPVRIAASLRVRLARGGKGGQGGARGASPSANCVGGTDFFGRSREMVGGETEPMLCWHQSSVRSEVVVRQW